ncbi:MAG TPA: DNA-formamidopyrimidine glycosylase family protein [Myxococcaceae bacterium]|nr:DNA-formamidopyrimidine glycosylase family protein [Myxococcaceae bacterium]
MPEGDTIFRAARTLHRALAGKTVTRFETGYAQLARVDDDAPIAGRRIEEVSAAGKHLLMRFSGDLVLRTHMRMNGSWHIYRPGEAWRLPKRAARVVVETEDFVAVAFDVPVAEFHTEHALRRQEDMRKMGPDLLSGEFDAAEAFRRVRERADAEIGVVLLNQRVMAGVGNAFKSEILFACRVNPFTPVRDLDDATVNGLVETSLKYLKVNVIEGASDKPVTYTGFRRTTGRADPAARLWVYGRFGQPCRRCGTTLSYAKQGVDARSTYWCPQCQPPVQTRAETSLLR